MTVYEQYLEDIKKYKVLSQDTIAELIEQYHNGDEEAAKTIVEHNLKLVVYFAKRYTTNETDMMDYIQAGNIGLIEAVKHYDPEKSKFSFYAFYWIDSKIRKEIIKGQIIRKSYDKYNKINTFKAEIVELKNELQREPTTEEIAEKTGLDVETVQDFQNYDRKVVSLSFSLHEKYEEGVIPFRDFNGNVAKEMNIEDYENLDEIYQLLECLDEREKDIIIKTQGIGGIQKQTLQGIANDYGISKERVRQLRNQAMRKLIIYGKQLQEEK